MGTWNIIAHYEGDDANAVSREFKVQKFGKWLIWLKNLKVYIYIYNYSSIIETFLFLHTIVLPSFEVNIAMDQNYILLNAEQFVFTISAM